MLGKKEVDNDKEVSTDGSFSLMYDDDDIFAGHVVVVDGNIEDGPDSAYIAG